MQYTLHIEINFVEYIQNSVIFLKKLSFCCVKVLTFEIFRFIFIDDETDY